MTTELIAQIASTAAFVITPTSVFLLSRRKTLGWPVNILACFFIFTGSWINGAYSYCFLQIIMVIVGVISWLDWRKLSHNESHTVPIRRLTLKDFTIALLFACISIAVMTYLSIKLGESMQSNGKSWPIIDATATALSIIGVYTQSKRYFTTWLFWFVADILAMLNFFFAENYIMSLLMVILAALAASGFINWRKEYLSHTD